MATDIRYILVDHKNHPIGEPSKVSCLDTDPVDGLKDKVKEKEQLELPTNDAAMLQHVELLFALSTKIPELLDE